MRKKIIFKLLVLFLMVAIFLPLVSCSKNANENSNTQKENKSKEKTSLVLWMPPFGTEESLDREVWGKIIKPFEEKNNVKVNIEIIPWNNYEEKYLTGISSGNGPDVGYMYMEMINDYIETNAIVPFDEYLTEKDKEKYYYLDKCNINGKQYGMPIVVGSARVMFYNKDILDAAGVEVSDSFTWEDFMTACEKIKKTGKVPFVQDWGNKSKGALNSIFFPYLWQAGGRLFDESGTKATFNSDAGIKALTFISDLKNKYGYMPDEVTAMGQEAEEAFKKGNVGFIVSPTNKSKEYNELNFKCDYITSLTDKEKGTFVATDCLVITNSSKNKELAASLVNHMLSGESMKMFHEMSPFQPISTEEITTDTTLDKIYVKDKDALHTLPAVKGSAAIYDNLYKNLQLVMMGEISPEEALKNTEDYAKNTLGK